MNTVTESTELQRRLRSLRAPRPVMDREREAQLTGRQHEVLERLSDLFDDGFAHLTMADIAAHLGCSLRTQPPLGLYSELRLVIYYSLLRRL